MRRGTPEKSSQAQPTSHYQREQVSQVKLVKHNAANRVLIDTGASIHLSGSHHFATTMQDIPPFRIFFSDSNSSVTISQTTTLKLLVKNGFVIIRDVPFSQKISGMILRAPEASEEILDAVKQLQVRLGTTPKALQTNNAWEITSASFTNALEKLGISFCPSLPYSPQENGEAERLNQMLGDMVQAMTVQSGMPEQFWQFAYSSAAFLHNRLPNSQCLNSLPHQELFGTAPSIATLYPFRADAIMHVPALNQPHKLTPRGIECKLLKPLMSGSWLLWEPSTNKMVQSASVIFPQFQHSMNSSRPIFKGSLGHMVNAMFLGEVLTERLFAAENQAVDSLTLVKDVNIHEHLGQALLGPHHKKWREACLAKLDQMATRDVWEAVEKKPGVKTICHRWVFDIRQNVDGSVDRFKARLVAREDRQ
ncbi:hypothetical protein O181_079553 [Austropuccinia psidii MF-1]|uniref:Integrase catalytic domain-containing protein n=1 Tax=Austropuccinia psidii MF-1 TaxID=1389203 RepID=A0A9Q3FGX0_9BASI|nr:hypothetical protein [Austropuccinia psidii MF-1]